MKVINDMEFCDFTFWAGACQCVEELTDEQQEQVWATLEELYPEGMTETEINDFFWFEADTIAEWLGFEDFDQLMESNRS